MPFTKRTAAAAARKRWKNNAQPNYRTGPALPREPESDLIDIAAEMPTSTSALAGGMPKWEDLVLNLDADAYRTMRVCIAIVKAVRKLAVRTAKLNWTIVGKGARADAIKEIFGQIKNWGDFVEWLTWALIEGVRFYQIKTAEARPGSTEPWKVPDFFMGGRIKANAGGSIEWDGAGNLVEKLESQGIESRGPKTLPIEQFVIHRPGGGSNPEGDLWLGAALFNSVGKAHPRGITSGDLYMRLFGIPAIMAGAQVDKARPDRISAMLAARAEKALTAMDNRGSAKAIGLSNEETVKLLQADPQGLAGIVSWLRYLESIADDTLAFGVLTSSSGISDAGRTGDTKEHGDEGDDAAFANGVQIAETFNRYVMPWILRKNPDLPALRAAPEVEDAEPDEVDDDAIKNVAPFQFKPKAPPKPLLAGAPEPKEPEVETEPYLWPKDPNETDAQDVSVESEGEDETGRDASIGEKPAGEKKPADMALIALRQIVQLQKKNGTVRRARGDAQLTPPVHPQCRCFIGPDDVWYDAQDARVCPMCMLLGASWNLQLDVPMSDAEVGKLLDKQTLDEFRKAVERDPSLADRVIKQAGESAESGIIKRIVWTDAESAQHAIEREIVKARAAARAAAPIQAGRVVPGLGTTPDALVFETTPIGKKATLVSVNVATGSGYRVIWRGGKYLLQTVGGRTLDSSGDLWWLLLLLALLEKKRHDEEERRKAQEAAQRQA